MHTWVVVTDSRRARIFEAESNLAHLTELRDLLHSRGQTHPDRSGAGDPRARVFDSTNPARHAVEPATSPKERESRVFAREIAQLLDRELNEHNYDDLVLVAPPHFLGLLRDSIGEKLQRRVQRTIDKDLVNYSVDELADYLVAQLH